MDMTCENQISIGQFDLFLPHLLFEICTAGIRPQWNKQLIVHLSKLLYFTIATVRCISPKCAFGDELIEYKRGAMGDNVSTNSCGEIFMFYV